MEGPGPETNQPLTFVLGDKMSDETLRVYLCDGLIALREAQRPLMKNIGFDTTDTETFARFGLALVIEAAEFVNELPWKQWKRREANPERVMEEFSDLLAFIGSIVNLMGMWGISTERLADAYILKLQENRVRFGPDHPKREAT